MSRTVQLPIHRALLFLALFALERTSLQAQIRHEFGFSLNPTAQGELAALFIYTIQDGMVVNTIPMRPEFFVLQASGLMESKANLESVDLFDRYGIANCGAWTVYGTIRTELKCSTIQDLWKLRYRDGMGVQPGEGWAGEQFKPSDRQQIILQFYRQPQYEHWHGPYFGDDAWRLLRDMQDPDWVKTYSQGG